jgi:hypothetical protein
MITMIVYGSYDKKTRKRVARRRIIIIERASMPTPLINE